MEVLALVWFWFYLLKPRLQRIERKLGLDHALSSTEVQNELMDEEETLQRGD